MRGMVREHIRQALFFRLQFGFVAETKIHHTRVRLVEAKHQFAEVAVIGDEDPFLSMSDRENLCVRQTLRIVFSHSPGIVAERNQKRQETGVGTLIKQESKNIHDCADTEASTNAGCCLEVMRLTAACAKRRLALTSSIADC